MTVTPIPPDLHNRLLLLLAGLAFDAIFGDLPRVFARIPHPVMLAGRAIAFFERKLNRPERSDARRRERGVVTVIILVGAAAALGWGIHGVCAGGLIGAAIEAMLVGVLLTQRGWYAHVAAVGYALERGGLSAGQLAVSRIVRRDPDRLDQHGVARAAIESLAENFSDGVVAPALWYLLLGLPGLLAYEMVNTLHSMIGHRSERYRAFGWAAVRLDDVMNLPAAPLSGLLLIGGAAFIGVANAARAGVVMLRDGRKHRSPNAGWPEAAMAGALGLALAGPRLYAEGPVHDPWLGDGSPQATPYDIGRALHLYTLACRLLGGLVLGAWAAAQFAAPL